MGVPLSGNGLELPTGFINPHKGPIVKTQPLPHPQRNTTQPIAHPSNHPHKLIVGNNSLITATIFWNHPTTTFWGFFSCLSGVPNMGGMGGTTPHEVGLAPPHQDLSPPSPHVRHPCFAVFGFNYKCDHNRNDHAWVIAARP